MLRLVLLVVLVSCEDVMENVPPVIDCSHTSGEHVVPYPPFPKCPDRGHQPGSETLIEITVMKMHGAYLEVPATVCKFTRKCGGCNYGFQRDVYYWDEPGTTNAEECRRRSEKNFVPWKGATKETRGDTTVITDLRCQGYSCCYWPNRYEECGTLYEISHVKILVDPITRTPTYPVDVPGSCGMDFTECQVSPSTVMVIDGDKSSQSEECGLDIAMSAAGYVRLSGDNKTHIITLPSKHLMFSSTSNERRFIEMEHCPYKGAGLYTNEGVVLLLASEKNSWDAVFGPEESRHFFKLTPDTVNAKSLDISRLEYEMTMLKGYTNDMLVELDDKICRMKQEMWITASAIRSVNEAKAIQILFDNRAMVGRMVGSAIVYKICGVLQSWRIRIDGKCGVLWKIEVTGDGIKCLDPSEMTTVRCPDTCEQNDYPVYFDLGNGYSGKLTDYGLQAVHSEMIFNHLSINKDPILSDNEDFYTMHDLFFPKTLDQRVKMLDQKINSIDTYIETGKRDRKDPEDTNILKGMGLSTNLMTAVGGSIWGTVSILFVVIIIISIIKCIIK